MTKEERGRARTVVRYRKDFQALQKKFAKQIKAGNWVWACDNGHMGISSEVIIEKRIEKVEQFILEPGRAYLDVEVYDRICPICKEEAFDPTEDFLQDVDEPKYEHPKNITDCRSDIGVTVGLIDAVMTMLRVIHKRPFDSLLSDESLHAIQDLKQDEYLQWLLHFPENQTQ
jgi:hypothetical protein